MLCFRSYELAYRYNELVSRYNELASCHFELVSRYYAGWSGGAMVLGKLPVLGRTTIWIIVGQGPFALTAGAGGGLFGHFYSPLSFPLFLPLSGRRPDID